MSKSYPEQMGNPLKKTFLLFALVVLTTGCGKGTVGPQEKADAAENKAGGKEKGVASRQGGSVAAWAKQLQDKDPKVRLAAAQSLATAGPKAKAAVSSANRPHF